MVQDAPSLPGAALPDAREHRRRLLELLEERSAAALVFSGEEVVRNADSTYRFRPASDFFWLTGFREPSAALLLLPGGEERSVLFLRPRDREQEVWTGRRLGVEAAPEVLGVDRAEPIAALWETLPELLAGCEALVFQTGLDEERDRRVAAALEAARMRARKAGAVAPTALLHPARTIHELRLRKSAQELACMRRAAAISAGAHVALMRRAAPGRNESELDGLLHYEFLRHGGTGPAYTNIVAGGPRACVLHYVENDQELRQGDLCLVDAGAEWSYYASDVTRTFPVGGRFTAEQRALYEVVLAAQLAAIDATHPGATLAGVHDLAVRRLVEGLVELGLLEGPVDRAIEDGSYRRFYMHRTGHWLGLDVHDCGEPLLEGRPRPLEPGMVTTVEPGIYVAEDDETVEPRWRGIGIRIEDDVLVTEEGNEVLSAAAPKTAEEVEAACAG